MRLNLSENNRPEDMIASVLNAETVVIPKGTPAILNLTNVPQPATSQDGFAAGFQDGLQVVLPGTAGANGSLFFQYGVVANDIAPQNLGESQIHGVCPFALVIRATRAASSDSWTSSASASSAGGYILQVNTANNAFNTVAAAISSNISLAIIMLDSIASMAASATNTSDTRTALLVGYRAFIRQM